MQLGLPFDGIGTTRVTGIDSTYYVRHRRARRYVLRVDPDGRLRVTIPRGGSRREADRFVQSQKMWVAHQRARLDPQRPLPDVTALRARACRELPIQLTVLAARYGLVVSRVSVRNQRARWGSCDRSGHICLNWRLVMMPEWVRDYVLVHELMHLQEMNHSPAYWRLVAAACPEYQAARQWLRLNGPSLH